VLAEALSAKIRPAAKQGDLFTLNAAAVIRQKVGDLFAGPKHDLLVDTLAEQNHVGKARGETRRDRCPSLVRACPRFSSKGCHRCPSSHPQGVPSVPPSRVATTAPPLPMPAQRNELRVDWRRWILYERIALQKGIYYFVSG
jgi:hypothetical protein